MKTFLKAMGVFVFGEFMPMLELRSFFFSQDALMDPLCGILYVMPMPALVLPSQVETRLMLEVSKLLV